MNLNPLKPKKESENLPSQDVVSIKQYFAIIGILMIVIIIGLTVFNNAKKGSEAKDNGETVSKVTEQVSNEEELGPENEEPVPTKTTIKTPTKAAATIKPTATNTPVPTNTPTNTPAPTEAPSPTETLTPTPTEDPTPTP